MSEDLTRLFFFFYGYVIKITMWSVYLHHPEIFENSSSTKDFLKFVCEYLEVLCVYCFIIYYLLQLIYSCVDFAPYLIIFQIRNEIKCSHHILATHLSISPFLMQLA